MKTQRFLNTLLTLAVLINSASASLVWRGGVAGNPNAWDVGTTSNWDNGGLPDYFYQGDRVTFDDTALNTLATISTQIQPAAMTNDASGSMVLNGTGNLMAGNLVANNGNFIIANTNDNLFNGEGIILNGGNVSFNQANNAAVSAKFSGNSGTLVKAGANTLTLTSNDSTNLNTAVTVQAGTLRPVGVNALGTDHVTIQGPGTLDINGQVLTANLAHHINGNGADGQGAINNRGAAQTNAVGVLALHGNSTVGAASNRWDVTTQVLGGGYNLTKLGAADIWIRTGGDTELGDINVNAGRLVFSATGTDVGYVNQTITIAAGATNGYAANISAGAKPLNILSNGTLASVSTGPRATNTFAGPINLNTNAGAIMVDNLTDLNLTGSITNGGTLIAGSRGNLVLSGNNNYRGGTVVRLGQLTIAANGALPTNSPVTLTNVGNPSSDVTLINLRNGAVTPASAPLTMYSSRSSAGSLACTLAGDGTWNGPLAIRTSVSGTTLDPQVGFVGGSAEGLTVTGPIDGTNQIGAVNITGGRHSFKGKLAFGGSVNIGNNGLGDATGVTMTQARFGAANAWTNTLLPRALVTLDTDNALPPNAPILVGTLSSGTVIHLIGFDLNGYGQTISSLTERAVTPTLHNDTVWFYNSSTNADSVLTYSGTGTNTWSAGLVDNFDPWNPLSRTLGLKVTSGRLILEYVADRKSAFNYAPDFTRGAVANTYTGPTLVSGGALIVNSELGLTPITVSGSGLFGGTGVISGPITIATGGTLAPGRSIGTMTATSDLVLQAGGKCVFEVNLGTGLNDQIVGLNNVTYGGTLVITNIGSQPFTNGTVLQLFSAASYTAGAVTIQSASPRAGLMWDASDLAVNGTLKVVPAVAPAISGTTRLPSGNIAFTLEGVQGQAYTIRASTNVALPLASWSLLSNGNLPATVSTFTDLTATNYPVRFYRTSTP